MPQRKAFGGNYNRVRVSRFWADPNSGVRELKKKGDTVDLPKFSFLFVWKILVCYFCRICSAGRYYMKITKLYLTEIKSSYWYKNFLKDF